MLTQKYQSSYNHVNYIINGSTPQILFTSGTHGDEYEIIEPLTQLLSKLARRLPNYLYLPEVSPSAVAAKTRLNSENLDLNRNFFNHSKSFEARSVMELLKKYHFQHSFSFHEDPEYFDFYLYDISAQPLPAAIITNLQIAIRAFGISLLNGYDDESDDQLKYIFREGYRFFPVVAPATNTHGMLSEWMFAENLLTNRFITFEIPGKLTPQQKTQLTELIFTHLILPSQNIKLQ